MPNQRDVEADAAGAAPEVRTSGSLARGLSALELLAGAPDGLPLRDIATRLGIPKAAAFRALSELVSHGYVHQSDPQGSYALSLRFVSLGLRFLNQHSVVDLARPALQRLAAASEELVRLCLVDGDHLFWIDKRQGAKTGLRVDDPDMGAEVRLDKSATGLAWLASIPLERALRLAANQDTLAHDAVDPQDVIMRISQTTTQGFAFADSWYEPGIAGMAVPVIAPGTGDAVALISIAGPSLRFTLEKATALSPMLRAEADQLAELIRAL